MVFTLPWPPSVGVYLRVFRNRLVKTKRARDYCQQVKQEVSKLQPFGKSRVKIKILAFPPDRRKRDLDNLLKVTLDSIEKSGLYDDDNQIDHIEIERRQVTDGGALMIEIKEAECLI